jgi:hypothetical protein
LTTVTEPEPVLHSAITLVFFEPILEDSAITVSTSAKILVICIVVFDISFFVAVVNVPAILSVVPEPVLDPAVLSEASVLPAVDSDMVLDVPESLVELVALPVVELVVSPVVLPDVLVLPEVEEPAADPVKLSDVLVSEEPAVDPAVLLEELSLLVVFSSLLFPPPQAIKEELRSATENSFKYVFFCFDMGVDLFYWDEQSLSSIFKYQVVF